MHYYRYANSFNTLFWRDVHDGTPYGFAPNQVTAFHLTTPDGETLYAWHILPLDQYTRHEAAIRSESRPHDGPVPDFTKTKAFELLTSDHGTPAKVVVSCTYAFTSKLQLAQTDCVPPVHGNAGHVAQGWRPAANRLLASQSNTHIFTIEYAKCECMSSSPF